ncbi:hypothetical protein COW46_05540 [Candidatus Gracilibacteria bacterium CG17_big_fil_post_rev_8_21_14_2_50_48_13]|nr:MAG: hypothetical protein COW46_05540 [Candidatus Gracilibacteria bacterium CG17_big_fil_post_rev_8_21_14_2_50_48_13]
MTKPYNHRDKFFKKAKASGLRARSFFKIEEIDQRLHLLRPGMHVLDLGAAPGSFMQYAVRNLGHGGYVLGVDLSLMQPVGGLAKSEVLQGDIFTEETHALVREKHPAPFDAVVSDLAPKTTGMKDVDHWSSIELSYEVLRYAKEHLKRGGPCLMKVFQGEDFDRFLRHTKKLFRDVRIVKPDATRDRSREVYVVGLGFTGEGKTPKTIQSPTE